MHSHSADGNTANHLENETAYVSQPFEASELELIEDALHDLYERSQRQPVTNLEAGSVDESVSSLHSQEGDGVARLLKKVQAVRAQKRGTLPRGGRSEAGELKSGPSQGSSVRSEAGTLEEEIDAADIRQVVQAASRAASAAAKAAQEVVGSVNRNSLALEELCKTLTSSCSQQNGVVEDVQEECEDGAEGASKDPQQSAVLEIELRQTEIEKNIARQNTVTHWLLGFIVVSTFVWRYGVVKFVKRINHGIQNPLEGLSTLLDGFKGGNDDDHSHKGHTFPRLKLPALLQREETEEHLNNHQITEESEEKDERNFKLGDLLPGSGET